MAEDQPESLRLTTRGYEMASAGRVPPSQFLRYLEHQRWRTISGSEGLPLRQFFLFGVVRAQVIELHRPVSFDVELELTVWLSRLGRTSLSLSHDIVRVSDRALVGRSTATLVALDSERRPAPVGDGAAAYLMSRETTEAERLGGAVREDAWSRAIDLRPSDQDMQGHVNHARYADFIDDARLLCAAAGGYGPGAWDAPVRKLTIAYEQESRVGEAVRVHSWVAPDRPATLDFVLTKDGGTVVTRARVELHVK